MNRPYFKAKAGEPEPLRGQVKRRVRFEEVDPLGIVWHGRYASYFEDARDDLGEKFGVAYLDFYHHGVLVPIKRIHVDFRVPLRFPDWVTIEAILHWSEAARLNYEFIIRNTEGRTAATGYTVQMMVHLDQKICMIPPGFYVDFLARWKKGELASVSK